MGLRLLARDASSLLNRLLLLRDKMLIGYSGVHDTVDEIVLRFARILVKSTLASIRIPVMCILHDCFPVPLFVTD